MFQFNSRGLLIPGTIIPSNLEEFKEEFALKPGNQKRKELFDQYQLYCRRLKNLCGEHSLVQWINGSYTTKSKSPADIDLVTFIDAGIVKEHQTVLKEFIYPQSMINYQLDAYIIAVHPGNSKLYHLTNADRLYWIDHFGKTKPNRHRKRVPKGFLEIII